MLLFSFSGQLFGPGAGPAPNTRISVGDFKVVFRPSEYRVAYAAGGS